LNLVISAAVLTSVGDLLFGKRGMDSAAIACARQSSVFSFSQFFRRFLFTVTSAHRSSRRAGNFSARRRSAMLGDVCLFLNMILFQVFWNMLTFAGLGHPSGVTEFLGRLFLLCFLALLIYFPPRMIYLADDIRRRRTWVMMLLANSPVIIRVLIGSGTDRGW
jgi:hypothetical protein